MGSCNSDSRPVVICNVNSLRPVQYLMLLFFCPVLQQQGNQQQQQTKEQTTQSEAQSSISMATQPWSGRQEAPLLGYDWIAGVLDNEGAVCEQPDDFYNDIKEFRRANKDDCITTDTVGR